MSKIKFNKEWYRDNDIVINCRTREEADKFINELAKVGVTKWGSNNELKLNSKFNSYKSETCYRLEQDYTVTYCGINFFEKEDYSIIKFSDLEFESDVIDKYLRTMTDTKIEAYKALINSRTVDKLEPSVETNTPIKRTILRGDVELKSGDVIAVQSYLENLEPLCYGIILNNSILYNDGEYDRIDSLQDIIDKDLVWYIKAEDTSLGRYISELLFKGELDDKLKDLVVYVQDKPKKPIKKEVEIFKVIFHKNSTTTIPFISDDETIFTKNTVSPISGIYANRYGVVESRVYDELTQEQINTYDKIIKIK